MSTRNAFVLAFALAAAPLAASFAAAQPRHPHPPPPEAFAACESQDEGSQCQFETPHGTLEGTCRTPREERLVCVPNHPPPGGRPGR